MFKKCPMVKTKTALPQKKINQLKITSSFWSIIIYEKKLVLVNTL